jgi:hypothetical protein
MNIDSSEEDIHEEYRKTLYTTVLVAVEFGWLPFKLLITSLK